MLCLGQPCVYGFYPRLSVCLISQKPMLNFQLNVQMYGSGKPIYFGVKMSKVKVTNHKNGADVGGVCTRVSAGF